MKVASLYVAVSLTEQIEATLRTDGELLLKAVEPVFLRWSRNRRTFRWGPVTW